jgi:L-alanine-DL-glutamate epimerase-like enolase superfamily enzyme
MKISKIEAIQFKIPLKLEYDFHYTLSQESNKFRSYVLVKVHTDDGLIGVAEAPPRPHLYGETEHSIITVIKKNLEPSLIGMNPFDLEKIHYRMERLKQNLAAKAAIDVAIHDIMGQYVGLPIYRMLGGWNDDKVPVAWMMGIKDANGMANEAKGLFDKGIKTFKIKVGIDPKQDIKNFHAIREAVGNEATLYVDPNQSYSPVDAIKIIKEMENDGIAWVEEPVSISIGERRLRVAQSISVPIAGDESCFTPSMVAREIEAGVIGLVVIKVARTGFYQSRKIIHLCEQAGIPCLIGTQGEAALGSVAALHLAKGFRHIKYPIENSSFLRLEDDLLEEPLRLEDGFIQISNKPGLGVGIDQEKYEKFKVNL